MLRQFMPQFGDEHMQAAGVEEAVVSPAVEHEYTLCVHCILSVSEGTEIE